MVASRSGTVGGLGGQAALKVFLTKATERDPEMVQAITNKHKNFILLLFDSKDFRINTDYKFWIYYYL